MTEVNRIPSKSNPHGSRIFSSHAQKCNYYYLSSLGLSLSISSTFTLFCHLNSDIDRYTQVLIYIRLFPSGPWLCEVRGLLVRALGL